MFRRVCTVLTVWMLMSMMAVAATKPFVVVIDAGHGGRDAGCVGAISKEKELTLKMALAIGRYIEKNCSDVKVVYTRKTDVFLELWQRAEIANRNKADLFISVHINALPGGKIARGFQTYTLGKGRVSGSKKGIAENLDVAKRENAVIVMEKDYKQHYEGFDPNSPESNIMFEFIQDTYMERSVQLAKYMQQHVCASTGRANGGAHQDNLAVLRLTSMPGCLLELGFISTSDEERFMNSKEAPEKYARGVFNAFLAYKKKYHKGGQNVNFAPVTDSENKQPEAKQEQSPKTKQEQSTKAKQEQDTKAKQEQTTKAKQEQPTKAKQEQSPQPKQPEVVERSSNEAGVPIFKVQITTSDRQLKAGSSQLKGMTDVDFYRENGLYKYTVGASADYNEVYRLFKTVREKIPDAFIIAFKNGEKMNVQQAIKEFKSNRSKQ